MIGGGTRWGWVSGRGRLGRSGGATPRLSCGTLAARVSKTAACEPLLDVILEMDLFVFVVAGGREGARPHASDERLWPRLWPQGSLKQQFSRQMGVRWDGMHIDACV